MMDQRPWCSLFAGALCIAVLLVFTSACASTDNEPPADATDSSVEVDSSDACSGATCLTECDPGSFGETCEPCPTVDGEVCGAGTCDDGLAGDGTCACVEGFTGDTCNECAQGYAGSECAKCPAGTYCDGTSLAAVQCPAEEWDDDADAATPCIAHSTCGDGFEVRNEGTPLVDTSCVDIDECEIPDGPCSRIDRICDNLVGSFSCTPRTDFRNADLEDQFIPTVAGADFTGANLRNARFNTSGSIANTLFVNADLSGATISDVFAEGADFSGATLVGASISANGFSGASFFQANLTDANLSNSSLNNADLTSANLTRANLSGCTFSGTKWTAATFNDTLCFDGVTTSDSLFECF